jgi:hypothetical protein
MSQTRRASRGRPRPSKLAAPLPNLQIGGYYGAVLATPAKGRSRLKWHLRVYSMGRVPLRVAGSINMLAKNAVLTTVASSQ